MTNPAPAHPSNEALEELRKAVEQVPELVLSRHPKVQQQVHGTGAVSRFNTRLAVLITNVVGSMWCAYVFCIIALIGLPSAIQQAQTQGPLPLVQWLAQTFLQLVLLSVIMVGQNVLQTASDARAEADHKTLLALKTINDTQLRLLKKAEVILERLPETEAGR
jgi:uncharacterized membrane protein